ncbi:MULTISPECIES: LysR family transcriptional regulator [Shewanella]|uniref:LysR family transcriptional regulator n=1 Tax=Shewanella metallivivens TaxID=2872342 RepID=A0ABT5TLG1_9GAMM|nr:LysR family transcriptional regulator [Shewanella metallivivens]MDD8059043.1 LysR family transcriptional regulator [Shewanella metallivivens]
MNLRQLHYFHELAKHKHFAKAAKACHITQPTLSASINALEKRFGTELVVRGSQFVALTEAGSVVQQYAEKMLLDEAALKQEISAFTGPLKGSLNIGIVPQSSVDIMPIIKHFTQLHPHISIKLHVTTNEKLLEQLTLHQMDIGLGFDENINESSRRQLQFYPQQSHPLAVLSLKPVSLELAAPQQTLLQQALPLVQLKSVPLILLSQNMQFRQYIDNAIEKAGGGFNIVLETDSLFHLVSAIKQGLGYAIVSGGIAKSAKQLHNLHAQTLLDVTPGDTVFMTRKYSVSVAMKAFIRLVEVDSAL